jgi:ATP-dependent DNA ligase
MVVPAGMDRAGTRFSTSQRTALLVGRAPGRELGPGAAMPTKSRLRRPDVRLASGLPQIEPIILTARAEAFDDREWMFEPKYDGFRGFVYNSPAGCEIRSRRDFRFDRFGDLCDRIGGVLGTRDAILDGEIVALNRQGMPVFRDLLRGQGYLAFAAFDLLWLNGTDFRPLPLVERKRALGELLPEDTGPLYKVLTLEEHGRALFSAIRKMDLEGIVAKRKSDQYSLATTWYKIENPGYSQGQGRVDLLRRRDRSRGRSEVPV